MGDAMSGGAIRGCTGKSGFAIDDSLAGKRAACARIFFAQPLFLAAFVAATLSLFGFAKSAVGQTSDAPMPETLKSLSLEELGDVEVTSVSKHPEKLSKSASAIQVITAEEIRRSGATSIPEALRLADNLDVAQINSHDWAISARGFNTSLANKLLVLIDGRAVYTPLFSGVFWNAQDYLLEDIARIEVISGPGGALWGANAVNGVINIITKNAKDTQGTYLETGGGTQPEDFAGVRYGTTLAPDVYLRVYGKYTDRSNEVFADGSDASDSWRMSQGGFRIDGELSRQNSFTVQGDLYGSDVNIATGGQGNASGSNVLGRWSHVDADGSETTLQVYYDRTHLNDPITNQFGVAQSVRDDLDTYDIDFQQQLRPADRQLIIWGLGFRFTHDVVGEAPNFAFLPAHLDQELYSAFVQDEITLGNDLLLTLGTKLEHNSYTGLEAEPSARLQWNLTNNQMLWGAISRAVRTPSRVDRDLAEPAPSSPPVILEGSPDFTSETVIAYELGYRAQLSSQMTGSISAFYNDYDDLRSTSFTPATIVPLFFQNNLEGHTYGLEVSVDYQVQPWWRLHGGYDPIREDIRVKPGQFDLNNALNETADPHARISLRSSMDLSKRVEFDAALRWIDSRNINDNTAIAVVPSYIEMDMRLGWHPTDKVELALVGQNLLHDHHFEYGIPGPTQIEIQRSVYGKVTWRF
jgi:iron complex outermembrane receptor protein